MSFPVDELRHFLNVFEFVSSRWMWMRPIPAASSSSPTGPPRFQGFIALGRLACGCGENVAALLARRSTRIPIELSTTVAVDVSQKQENDRHHDGEANDHGESFAERD